MFFISLYGAAQNSLRYRHTLHLRPHIFIKDTLMMYSRQPLTVQAIRGSPYFIALAAAGLLALAGCATPPVPPTQALQAAESAISNAEQARVADYASAELTTARQKLAQANTAVRNNQMVQGEYLAVESRTHAEVALARAEELKAKAVNDDMQKSIDTLKQEMQRATGARQ
jgi:ribosome-associated translation inhibitor RaiA